MKVLKEGKWNVPWSTENVCATCEATLLVEESDVKATDYGTTFHFVCAVFGKVNYVAVKELPLRVSEEKEKKRKYSTSSAWD